VRYTAIATRSGGWWAVEVPEVPGVFTQARRLAQIPAMAADAVEMLTGERVEVDVIPSLPPDLIDQQRIQQWQEESRQAAELADKASKDSRDLVAQLRAAGLSVRDIGEILGLSSQRVSQLAPSVPAPHARSTVAARKIAPRTGKVLKKDSTGRRRTSSL